MIRYIAFLALIAGAIAIGAARAALADVPISYKLPTDGRVSVAIYSAQGRLTRTLLNSELQKAGEHQLAWEGLDQNGRAVSPGQYTWKLVHGPGIKAEYLLSLGTNVGIHHWVAQHGGPDVVAVDGDAVIVGGHPEGSPMLCKVKFDGTYVWPAYQAEAAKSTISLALRGDRVAALSQSGTLFFYSRQTGERERESIKPLLSVKTLAGVAPNRDPERTLSYEVPNGRYLLRVKAGHATSASTPFAVEVAGKRADVPGVAAGNFREIIAPELYRWPHPVEVKNGKLEIKISAASLGKDWAIESIELLAPASRIAVYDDALAAAFPSANTVAWLDMKTGGVLHSVAVDHPIDLKLVSSERALVLSGKKLLSLTQTDRTELLSGLEKPAALAVDAVGGGIFIAEGGTSQQIKQFDKVGKPLRVYGRMGGRLAGLYQPRDFLAVADIAADGQGGFVIVEALSAPRRTAHFDQNGNLVREWYGGQQFYTFAAPEPDNPELVWMDSQWGWLTQAQVDYEKRTWKVRACYRWADQFDHRMLSDYKMASRMYPVRLNLTGSAKNELYLWSQSHHGLLLKVDEPAGKIRPVAALGIAKWTDKTPENELPVPWAGALERVMRPGAGPKCFTGFGWADYNGDFDMQADELRLLERGGHGFGWAPGCLWLDRDLRIWSAGSAKSGPAHVIRAPVGRTRTGAPIWDWASATTPGPAVPFSGSRFLRLDSAGNIYQVFSGGGDGFAAGIDSFHSHGFNWPATLVDATAVVKFDNKGEMLWRVANHASRRESLRGTSHYPICIAGFARNCVGVCDYAVTPCQFWTDDGLYVGELLDSRSDDGLPATVYAWWLDPENPNNDGRHHAIFQYDMLVGGSLFQRKNGDVIFMGAGWNNVPVYRVHGLDRLARQEGSLTVTAPASVAGMAGTGLRAEYFAGDQLQAPPSLTQVDPQIWFGPKHVWPEKLAGEKAFSARWSGTIEPRFSEEYTFALYLRGGARLRVNGQVILDSWDDQKERKEFSKPVRLRSGQRTSIECEWRWTAKSKGDPEAHLSWESPSQPIEHIPAACLYSE